MIYLFLGGFACSLLPAFLVMLAWSVTSAVTSIEE